MSKVKRFLLDFFACFLIPGYTLLFAGSVQWFSTNFSVIAVTGPDHYRGFVYWGLLAGGYFLFVLSGLAVGLPQPGARLTVRVLTAVALLSLAYAVAIPYLPAYFPKHAVLHVALAAEACVLLMVALLLVILFRRQEEPDRWQRPFLVWKLIVLGCAVIFLIPRMVSTALEVFFTISAALLARKMLLQK
ncbi:hypothetical protein D1646_13355 [Pseudoflavonifractor sp. 60]|uniref:hypothetical protein n=1 Tax=Pseudoflavonifractor sp. 60 TaxID=2304576 RepID=UPI00136FE3F6|nr:hypothetical protein [Pseudoflavonifractor sp. 60]NBI67771.1 hypothetical protein [Pseudoflavonifractor sp. 60]